jgi:hypothetical protein
MLSCLFAVVDPVTVVFVQFVFNLLLIWAGSGS